jgi:hypothetical protein
MGSLTRRYSCAHRPERSICLGEINRCCGCSGLYGLKEASRAWNKRLEGELRAKEFEQSDADPALWILHGKGGAVLAMFYVDDGLVVTKTVPEADALVDLLGSMFEIRKIGEPEGFLGIHICRDHGAGTITVDQKDKAVAVAAELGVSGKCKVVPMSPEVFGELRGHNPWSPWQTSCSANGWLAVC